MKIAVYDTDLTEAQWALVKPLLPAPEPLGRPRTDLRRILNALLYVAKAGCQWRLLSKEFPAWQTVYHVFRKWARDHVWEALNARLRAAVRARAGRRSRPTAAILDSQSVKSDPHGGPVGYDAGKQIKGRKRHLLVDTLGLLLGVHVTPANTPERAGAQALLARVLPWLTWLRVLWADGGYTGAAFAAWVRNLRPKLAVTVVKRSDPARGFTVLAHRWVVERTFGWLMRQRRLVRDYETSAASAEAFVLLAMIRIQIRRLA
jgi:transposase